VRDTNHFAPIRAVLIESRLSEAPRGKFSEKIFNRLAVAREAGVKWRSEPRKPPGAEKILSWIVVSVLQISIVWQCFFSFGDLTR